MRRRSIGRRANMPTTTVSCIVNILVSDSSLVFYTMIMLNLINLHVVGYSLHIVGYNLHIVGYSLHIVGYSLHIVRL